MSQPFLGEIRIVSFNFPPNGWALCNGQLLAITQNQALFALLGTAYGGDGIHNFALPNLQGAIPLHFGNSAGNIYSLGQTGGESGHTLLLGEIPAHDHTMNADATSETTSTPAAGYALGQSSGSGPNGSISEMFYGSGAASGQLSPALSVGGGSQSHENRSPFLALTFAISLTGIFPSRN
jgi:microcystin-dependent protein